MLVAIIFIAFILRLISLFHAGSFWFDEAFTLYFARLPWREAWYYLQFENNPPLHFFLAHLFVLFSQNELLLRITSLITSLLTIPVIYHLGKKLHSRIVGLVATALFAVSGLSIFNAVEFRMYPLVTLLSALSILFFLSYLEDQSRKNIIILTFTNTLLVLTHLTGIAVVGLEIAYIFWRYKNVRWRVLLWQAIPGAALLIWALPSFGTRMVTDLPNAWYFGESFDPFFFLKQCYAFLIYPSVKNLPLWLVTGIGLGLFLMAMRAIGNVVYIKEERRVVFKPSALHFSDLLLLLAFAPVVIGAIFNVQIPKQYSVSLVPFILLLAVGLIELIKEKKLSWTVISIGFVAIIALNYPALWRPPYALDQLVQTIKKEETPKAKILAAAHIYTLPLELYYHGSLPVVPIYMGADAGVDKMRLVRHNWHINYYSKEDLNQFLTRESKNYMTMLVVGTTHWQSEGDIVRIWFMTHGWQLARTYSWDGYFNPDLHVFKKILK